MIFYLNIYIPSASCICLMMVMRRHSAVTVYYTPKGNMLKEGEQRRQGGSALSRKSGNWGRGAKFVLRSRLLEVEHAFVHFYCTQQNIVYLACVCPKPHNTTHCGPFILMTSVTNLAGEKSAFWMHQSVRSGKVTNESCNLNWKSTIHQTPFLSPPLFPRFLAFWNM